MVLLSLIIFCLFVTIKYHLRFNEGRKFHDLSSTDLSKSIPANKIDEKLSGLNWISPEYKNNVEQEKNSIGDKMVKISEKPWSTKNFSKFKQLKIGPPILIKKI